MKIIPNENTGILIYANLLSDIKIRIRQAQVKATFSANTEMIMMYWDVGRMIHERQQQEGWSASIIPHLSRDLRNELPEVKGFSERNLGRMLAFFRNYQNIESFLPQPVAKSEILHQPVAKLPPSDLIRSIPMGASCAFNGENKREFYTILVYDANYPERMEQGYSGADDQKRHP